MRFWAQIGYYWLETELRKEKIFPELKERMRQCVADPEPIEEDFKEKDSKEGFFIELIEKCFEKDFKRYGLTSPSVEHFDRYIQSNKVIDEDAIERLLAIRPELLRDLLNLLFYLGEPVIEFAILKGKPYLVKDCPKNLPIDTCLLLVDNKWIRVKINNGRITYLD